MSIEELKTYLKAAIDLETDVATQEQIIQQYEKNCQVRQPQLELKEEPPEPKQQYSNIKQGVFAMGCLGSSVGFFLLMFIGLLRGFFIESVILGIIGVLLCLPYYLNEKAAEKDMNEKYEVYKKRTEEYRSLLEKVQKENTSRKRVHEQNTQLWKKNKDSNNQYLNQNLEQTKAVLEKLYSKNFIYEKYRNLPALTSIYEYFLIGRCDSLTGPYGAYSVYEDEIRKDTIISQLQTVIENLEAIKQNQYVLYKQVKEIQNNTAVIALELDQIRGYTANIAELSAVSAYYAALTARNTEVTMACHLLS